jgi:glycosyltransferase involved in cell wall biosynthesis
VEDGANGFVATPEPEALSDAIDRLFALPEGRLREMGENVRLRVEHISWDVVVDRLTETIR